MATLTPNKDSEVTVIEQGELTLNEFTGVIGGTGYKIRRFEVPVGKQWKLKNFESSSTATLTNFTLLLSNPDESIQFTLDYQTTGLGSYGYPFLTGISMPEGWKIMAKYLIVTDANTNTRLLFMESDI